MKIGIEIRQVVLGSSGGIAMLVKGVLESLFTRHPDHDFIVFSTIYNRNMLEKAQGNVKVITLPTHNFFSDVDRICREEKIVVLFRTYPMEDDLTFPLSRQIFLMPDIQHEFFPDFFTPEVIRARRSAFNMALVWAGAIGTLSEFTRNTIQEHAWTRCQDIFLVGPALPKERHNSSVSELLPEEKERIPQKDFFLYPANLWPHKNHRLVIEAFADFLHNTKRDIQFVFTGHSGKWEILKPEMADLPVVHLGFVRPQLLSALYREAKALVFFSLYEWFGIPLLEAFYAGIPVICSNTTSLPEVGGKAVLSCDPTDPGAIADLMERIVRDDPLRGRLIAEGKRRLSLYSWQQSSQNLFEACQRVANRENQARSVRPVILPENPQPLVSIVTPSLNQGRFLKRTIESVLNQSYPHIEYFVVDGGSTDNSIEILESFGQMFSWVSEPDRGQSDAINKGFERSKGEIRAYLNSDDVLLPHAVEKVVAHCIKRHDWDLIYGRAQYIDESDEVTGMYNTADYSFERLMQDCCVCQPAAFWRTRIAQKIGPFNWRLQYAMDYEYWLRIYRGGGCIHHVHDTLAGSRLYAESKTRSFRRKIYNEIFQVCLEQGGYVDYSYFVGLWDYLVNEEKGGWPARLRWVPKLPQTIGFFHHKWFNGQRDSWKQLIENLGKRKFDQISHALPGIHTLWRFAWPFLHVVRDRRPVTGLWADNWLGPKCCFHMEENNCARDYYIGGIPALDMRLTIKVGGKTIRRQDLKANQYEMVRFRLQNSSGEEALLGFSEYAIDAARRPLSFLLMDTNLFREENTL